jgi:hypothetical protein
VTKNTYLTTFQHIFTNYLHKNDITTQEFTISEKLKIVNNDLGRRSLSINHKKSLEPAKRNKGNFFYIKDGS